MQRACTPLGASSPSAARRGAQGATRAMTLRAAKRLRVCGAAEDAAGLELGDELRVPGLVCRDLWLDVPLDHGAADGGGRRIRLYAREVRCAAKGRGGAGARVGGA